MLSPSATEAVRTLRQVAQNTVSVFKGKSGEPYVSLTRSIEQLVKNFQELDAVANAVPSLKPLPSGVPSLNRVTTVSTPQTPKDDKTQSITKSVESPDYPILASEDLSNPGLIESVIELRSAIKSLRIAVQSIEAASMLRPSVKTGILDLLSDLIQDLSARNETLTRAVSESIRK